MTVPNRIKKVMELRRLVEFGNYSLEIVENVVSRAERGEAVKTHDIDLINQIVNMCETIWPTAERPPEGITNIVDKARCWADILRNEFGKQKAELERAEKNLTEEDEFLMYMGTTFDPNEFFKHRTPTRGKRRRERS